jgi:hypothetical protein
MNTGAILLACGALLCSRGALGLRPRLGARPVFQHLMLFHLQMAPRGLALSAEVELVIIAPLPVLQTSEGGTSDMRGCVDRNVRHGATRGWQYFK